jgi:hypothetical protein
MKLLGRDHPILVTLTGVTLLIHNIRSYVYIYIYIVQYFNLTTMDILFT